MTIRAHLGWCTALVAVTALTSAVWAQDARPSRSGAAVPGAQQASTSAAPSTAAAVGGQPASSLPGGTEAQSGLPPELFIPDKPSLTQQRQALEKVLAAEESVSGEGQGQRRGGILEGLKSLFTGRQQVLVVDVPTMAANAENLRAAQVEVHGVLRQAGGKLYFAGQHGNYEVDLAGGVEPEGFPEGPLDWMPAVAKGLVELPFGQPLVHATSLTPSAPLALLRLARLLEVEGQTREALETYQHAATELQRARLGWAAFASCHAGWLAYSKLRDPKLARQLLSAAWMLYAVQNHGRPGFDVWTPRPDGQGWVQQDVATAIGPLLDTVGRENFWYRLVDFFVTAAGGSAAIGVILLALVTRLVLHPLTVKQLWSAEEMRRLQPQIKALQEEFKDDKQRFQQEMWRLWQEHGVNPFGGCWPMLVQMPILIFVYQGIRGYIVRFSQSHFLWVRNMALPDLPLLIGYTASMVVFQQMANRMQPMPADERQRQQQQMMTWMMPLMFFFFFKTLPSAFILYWLASNLFYFGEQWLFRYQVRQREARGETPTKRPRRSRFMEALMRASQQAADKQQQERASGSPDTSPNKPRPAAEAAQKTSKPAARKRKGR